MQSHNTICPVCTLYLREGITLQSHLDTHPKEQVIEALLKVSNGGSMGSPHYPPPTSVNPYLPLHHSSPYSHLNHTSPYATPSQAQMTTAVTYQHFMTSNGSSLLPHYVPSSSSSSSSALSNPALNYGPGSSVNYAHTLYNPLYNPYIPQPYPFTPPLLSGYPPLSSLPPVDSNTETGTQESSLNTGLSTSLSTSLNTSLNSSLNGSLSTTVSTAPTETIQTDAVKKCTVGTSTEDNKKVTKNSGSKKSVLRTPNRRSRILRQRKSTVAKKSVKNGGGTDAKGSTSTTTSTPSVEMTTTVIRTLRPKTIAATAASVAASANNKPRIISPPPPPPPPLKLIVGTSIPESMTPPLPLAKSPYLMPRIFSCIKSEDVPDLVRPQSVSTIINDSSNSSSNLNFDYMGHHRKMSTVIVENCNSIQSGLSEIRELQQTEECKEQEEDEVDDPLIEVVDTDVEPPKDPLYTAPNEEIIIDEHTSKLKECPEEDQGEETTIDVEDRQEKVFQMIEVEDNKDDITEEVLNQDMQMGMGNGDMNRGCDGSNRYIEDAYNEDSNREKANKNYPEFVGVESIGSDNKLMDSESDSRPPPNEFGYFNKEYAELSCDSNRSVITENIRVRESNIRGPENSSVTYTDLQPAKTSKIFRELEDTQPLNFNNFTDGAKIVFNNETSDPPSDPLNRAASKLRGGSDPLGFLKSEHQGSGSTTIVDSVIQIVSSTGESKGEFTFRDSYSASTSHMSSESNLDNSQMSPLALNIQADESMPARGELSEQESLGAENTTWNLYHGNNAVDIMHMRTIEEWRNENAQSVSVIGTKKNSKSFRCSICNEVFSCPKERRVHKNTVHVTKSSKTEKSSPGKKPRNYECNFCSEVFTSIRDRKQHVSQNHVLSVKNRKTGSNEIKMETAEPEYLNVIVGPDGGAATAEVKKETEQEQKFKTEIPSATTTNVTTTVTTPSTVSTTTARSIPTPSSVDPSRMKFCTKCSLPFDGMKKLREHLRLTHGEVRFKCDKCSTCFDEETEYNDHLLIHPLACEKCGKTFHRKPNLNLHMKRHLEVKPYECSLCPKSFITRQKLEEHMNGHSGKKPIKCSLCDKTFSRHSNLIQHRNLHHFNVRKKLKDYVCRCGEVFHSLKKLEWHKEIHDRKPKPCPFCSQKFIHSASVTRHIRRSHVPEYLPGDNRELDNVSCPICEKVYLRSSLVVHLRVHNGEKPFQCKICNKRFSTKWNLELHNWTHQSRNNMPFKCHICKSAFFREPDFVAHLNSHRNYKPFTCNICGQKFIRKYSCLRHQEEHKKAKQFVCAVNGCEKSFHRGYYLRDHMKVHTGLRPHTCHICGKASSTKSNHNKHVRIHDTREPVNTEN